jgi:hypothetical protein
MFTAPAADCETAHNLLASPTDGFLIASSYRERIMRPRILTSSAVLAAAWLILIRTPTREAEIKPLADSSTTQPPTAQAFVNWFYDELREHGEINYPDLPWVVRAKHVRGDQLQIVKFLHRDKSGKGYDFVGAAVTVVLCADKDKRTILVHHCSCDAQSDDGSIFWSSERITEAEVPERLPGRKRELRMSFATAEQHATPVQRKFLKEECFGQPTQKRLQQAFGRECDELARDQILDIPSRGLLMAFDHYDVPSCGPKGSVLFKTKERKIKHCSIAHFSNDGSKVVGVERATERTLALEEYLELLDAALSD